MAEHLVATMAVCSAVRMVAQKEPQMVAHWAARLVCCSAVKMGNLEAA